jgi:D-xylose transport system substrate-binding protein
VEQAIVRPGHAHSVGRSSGIGGSWHRRLSGSAPLLAAAAIVAVLAGACGGNSGSSTSSGGTIAFLLKENKTARWEAFDHPYFVERFKQLCPSCNVIYNNAEQDAAKQQNQADAALANGAKVLVITPVDSAAAAGIVKKANAQGVPVIAYDALITGADIAYFVSFQNEKVGELQGQALLDRLNQLGATSKGKIVMINGSPTDNNAGQFKKGAHAILDGKVQIGKEYDTPDWSPDKAQQEMEQALTALGPSQVVGVYAANDGTAGGAIAAMRAAGMTQLPPVTGQDAELAAIQRIVLGQQYMTVYKAIKPEAYATAELAYQLLQGKRPTEPDTVNNGSKDVPSVLLTPVSVTTQNISQTVVKDGFYTVPQICTVDYAAACKSAGLT